MKLNVLGRKTQMLTKLTLNCPVFSQKHELPHYQQGSVDNLGSQAHNRRGDRGTQKDLKVRTHHQRQLQAEKRRSGAVGVMVPSSTQRPRFY